MGWKYAISSAPAAPATAPILLKGEVVDNLRTAAALGYDAIEVHTRETAVLDYANIRAVAADCGCRVGMIVTGRLNTEGGASLLSDDPALERMALEGMHRYIDMAAELDAGIVLGWVRGKIPAGKDRRPYWDRLGEHLCTLGDHARTANVPINIEVINRYETNVFVTADETLEFLQTYQPENCLVHLDTFHMNIEETDMVQAIVKCAGKLGYVHFADNTRCYPGTGTIDFQTVLDALRQVGYQGYLSVECLPRPDEMQAAAMALQTLKKLSQ